MKFEKSGSGKDIPLNFIPSYEECGEPLPSSPPIYSLKEILTPKSEINQVDDRRICKELEVAEDPRFQRMHSFDKMGATTAETVLTMASFEGHLSLTESLTAIDFGAGSGGPTLAVAKLVEINGGTAEAIETELSLARYITEDNILPAENVHMTDGIVFLQHPANEKQYDLITAFMLGPDKNGTFSRAFLSAATHALEENGRIVVTSENYTLANLEAACRARNMRCDRIIGVPLSDRLMLPDTLVISVPAPPTHNTTSR